MTRQLLPLATSVLTLVAMWRIGAKKADGWAIGLANQGLWLWFIAAFDAWGLLPLTAALTVVYARNLIRWRREDKPLLERGRGLFLDGRLHP